MNTQAAEQANEYILALAIELEQIAARHGLNLLAYLLSMVVMAARGTSYDERMRR